MCYIKKTNIWDGAFSTNALNVFYRYLNQKDLDIMKNRETDFKTKNTMF